MASTDIELASPPDDGISSVKFAPSDKNSLLVSSWDCELRLYDISSNIQKSHYSHKAAVLGCCYSDNGHAFSGGLDTWVRAFDLGTETTTVLGAHTNAISSVVYSRDTNLLYTGSWDQTVRSWDPRVQTTPTQPTSAHPQPERVYGMDLTGNTLVVAMAGRLVNIYDLRNMVEPTQRRESSLRFMTKTVACMANGEGFAMTSVEGRIAVEYFDPSPEIQGRKYAFKCHRQSVDGEDVVWPVNALAFHPIHNTFASGGSDGTISFWDHTAKKRLKQLPKYPTGVSALAFADDGSKLAIGVSYAWDLGDDGAKKDENKVVQVRVRDVGDEAKPKVRI
ncbi:hypothetical protein FRC02_011130 [Tulasnella sp. 418]|nr:hypothetical protein FRC02_011130 [Tulasnella sp. 418]